LKSYNIIVTSACFTMDHCQYYFYNVVIIEPVNYFVW